VTAEFAAAMSEHPVGASATGEVVGRVLEDLDGPPDLALVFVTAAHAGALEDIAGAIRATLRPAPLLGCSAESVLANGHEVEGGPAVSLWAGRTGAVTPFHLELTPTPDGHALTGWPDALPEDAAGLLLLPDPFSFPTDGFLTTLAELRPGLPVVGGMASAGRGPGQNRLVVDDRVVDHGAVGAFLGRGVELASVVSQGCRPVGSPFIVTSAERNIVQELAGQPALSRLQELVRTLAPDERQLLSSGLHLGQVIDERKADFGRGDFLIRNVLGADPQTGAIAVGDVVEVGSTVQFQVRDAASAHEDLSELLEGATADAALVFTCNGRGIRLFGSPDHDAEVVASTLGRAPVAGMFCAGELGPVGGKNFLHGFTASVVLLNRTNST
jgi:small ligand-binding sensory domain FIST